MSTFRLFVAVFLAEIFCVWPSLAAVGSWNGVAFTAWNGVAQTSWNGTAISCVAAYAFYENFEVPTTGYDNTGWSTSGSPNPVYATSPAPLQGTQSLRLPGGSYIYRTVSGSTINIYFLLNITTWADFAVISQIDDGGAATIFKFTMWSPNTLRLIHGATTGIGATAISTGTTYSVWLDYTKGTGGDGVANLYISTTTTKPGSPEIAITLGTATTNVDKLYFYAEGSSVDIMDHIITNPTNIGSNP